MVQKVTSARHLTDIRLSQVLWLPSHWLDIGFSGQETFGSSPPHPRTVVPELLYSMRLHLNLVPRSERGEMGEEQ